MGGLFCYGLRQIYLKCSGGCAGVSQRTSVCAKTGLQKFCKKTPAKADRHSVDGRASYRISKVKCSDAGRDHSVRQLPFFNDNMP